MGMYDLISAANGWHRAAIAGLGLSICTLQANAIECESPLSSNEVTSSLLAESTDYYENIPASLRLDDTNGNADDILCDVYRAANGMQGALCISYLAEPEPSEAESGETDSAVVVEQPLGSYGDNAVDRLLQVPVAADGTISCDLVTQLEQAGSAQPFLPVETNPRAGQVCVRDVTRAPGIPQVQNALIRDSAGAEFSTGALMNDGNGCFSLDGTFAAGVFEVIGFEVDAYPSGFVDLGQVANLTQPEVMTDQLSRVWFIEFGADGNNSGNLANPFNSLATFNAAQGTNNGPQAGDFIYVVNSNPDEFSAPLTLLDGQWLVGRGEGLLDALAAYGLMPAENSELNNTPFSEPGSGRSDLSAFERPSVTLARDNTLLGLSLTTAFAPALMADNLGTLTIRNTSILANNGGIGVFANMELDVELSEVFAGGGLTVNGLDLQNTTGRLQIEGGDIIAFPTNDDPELGRAVSMTNATNVSLEDLDIRGTTYGIFGRNVENFSLINSNVTSANARVSESTVGVDFENLTGQATLDNVQISSGSEANLRIQNFSGELNAMLSGLDLGEEATETATSMRILGNADSRMSITLSESQLHGARNRAAECIVEGNANLNCFLVDNRIFQVRDENQTTRYREQPLLFASTQSEDATSDDSALNQFVMNYAVAGTTLNAHTINDSFRGAIAVNFNDGRGTANGVITNLLFGIDGDPLSGALFGNAIEVTTASTIEHNLVVTDTNIFGAFNDGALRILGGGNTSTTISNLRFYGEDADLIVQVSDTANAELGTDVTHCVDISNSTLVGWDSPLYFALSQRSAVPGRIRLPGYQGSPDGEDTQAEGNASADVADYLQARGVNLISFNPEITPGALAANVVGLAGGQEACGPVR